MDGTGGMELAAVVVSHNSRRELGPCLEALLAQEPPVEVAVVDNASTDGSPELVRERFGDRVLLVEPGENTGFAGGCNRGLAAVAAPLVAFMNPDVTVRPGCLAAAAACLARHPRAGAVAPLLVRPDGETVDSAGQCLARWTLEVRDRGYGRPLTGELCRERRVLAACGALAVFRREALDGVAMDGEAWAEPYFCFWEDLEMGWRLNNAGWEVWVCPEAVAVHGRGAGAAAGTGPLRWRRPVHLEACILSNRWMTLARHLHALDLAWRAPVLLAWDLAMTGAGILRRPRLLAELLRRAPLVRREWRRRRHLPRRRLKELPC